MSTHVKKKIMTMIPGLKKAALLLLILAVIPLIRCAESWTDSMVIHDTVQDKNQGWVGDDSYMVTAVGFPSKKFTDPDDKKKSSKKAAILKAHMIIIDVITNKARERILIWAQKHPNAMIDIDFSPQYREKVKEIKSILKNGKVLEETYRSDESCLIKFMIESSGLKQKFQYFKEDPF